MNKMKWYPGRILKDGCIYVAMLYDEERKQYYRLAMYPKDEPGVMTWDDARKKYPGSLPSKRELSAIEACLPKALQPAGTSYYWSSTEYSNGYAWIEQFSGGYQYYTVKITTYLVRCVRRFNYQTGMERGEK